MVDTSTEAVTKLLDGVTHGPWWCMDYTTEDPINAGWYVVPHDAVGTIAKVNPALGDDASFIAAARELVPALLAERDALKAERDKFEAALARACLVGGTTYLIERATKAEAEVERLKAQLGAPLGNQPSQPVAWAESYDGGKFFHTVSLSKTKHHTFPLYIAVLPSLRAITEGQE